MRIVSQNSDDDLNRRRLEAEFAQALRKLTANLLRVTRGAGKPSAIGLQAQEILDVIDLHEDTFGYFPWAGQIPGYLDVWVDHRDCAKRDEEYYRRAEEDQLLRAALQLVASRMLGQHMQEGTAQRDLYAAIEQINRRSDELKKKRVAEIRAAKAATKPVRRKRKVKSSKTVTRAD